MAQTGNYTVRRSTERPLLIQPSTLRLRAFCRDSSLFGFTERPGNYQLRGGLAALRAIPSEDASMALFPAGDYVGLASRRTGVVVVGLIWLCNAWLATIGPAGRHAGPVGAVVLPLVLAAFAFLTAWLALHKDRPAIEGWVLWCGLGPFGTALELLMPHGMSPLADGKRCTVTGSDVRISDRSGRLLDTIGIREIVSVERDGATVRMATPSDYLFLRGAKPQDAMHIEEAARSCLSVAVHGTRRDR